MSNSSLQQQVALVTGASRGIGRAIALAFAHQGASVAGTATTRTGVEQLSQLFIDHGLNGQGFLLDVKELEASKRLLTEIKATFGVPTILVNNAGITDDSLLLRLSEEAWETVINTHLRAVYRLSKLCLRGMLQAQFGRIINISSVVGVTGNAGQANYAAAKAGIIGFSKSLAQEIATRGITVNVIAPGFIETDMTMALSVTQRQALLDRIPCKQFGQVEDIAAACVFLASMQARYITGHTLHVNGGLYMN